MTLAYTFNVRSYYLLTKPGILFGNALTATAGFCLSAVPFQLLLFLATLVGLSLTIASACLLNNLIDRSADRTMLRTKKRAEILDSISTKHVLSTSFLFGISGLITLYFLVNPLAAGLALFGFFFYVILYSFSKYYSVHSTLIGSVSGAIPPVVGYAAAASTCDLGALLIFLFLVCWQMPHFFAISIYRLRDYKAASIPVFPLQKGILATKIWMFVYTVAFAVFAFSLFFFKYTGIFYLVVLGLLTPAWILLSFLGFFTKNDGIWARQMFGFSLLIITVFSFILVLGKL